MTASGVSRDAQEREAVSRYDELPSYRVHPENAAYWGDVRCVEMPCCGFTFAADHTDADGLYSCPQCDPHARSFTAFVQGEV